MPYPYAPMPIALYQSGEDKQVDPWLLPKDAFETVTNCYMFRGIIYKRLGTQFFGQLVHAVTSEVFGAGNGVLKTFTHTLAQIPVRAGNSSFSDVSITDTVETFTDDGTGALIGSLGGTGTINYTTGVTSITFNTAPINMQSITATYNFFPGLPVMGLYQFITSTNDERLMAFTTKRLNIYNVSTSRFDDVSGADTWTGTDINFFSVVNWRGKAYITNNVNQIRTWDGSSVALFVVDYVGDAANHVTTCLWIQVFKGRLVLGRPTEIGGTQPQEVRFSAVNDPTNWLTGGASSLTAPTSDWIQGQSLLRDDLIIFFSRSTWALGDNNDSNVPYFFSLIDVTRRNDAPFGVSAYLKEVKSIGSTGLIGCDRFQVYRYDQKLPFFTLNVDQSSFAYCYAHILIKNRQLWTTFPQMNQSVSTRVLVQMFEEGSFSEFDLALSCMGQYENVNNLIWKNATEPWQDYNTQWQEMGQDNELIDLGGTHDGYVVILNSGANDLIAGVDTPIFIELVTPRWNPDWARGEKTRFLYVDFLLTTNNEATCQVEFFYGDEVMPYLTQTLDFAAPPSLLGANPPTKVIKRLYCGAIGTFHRLRITDTSQNNIEIHAISPWFTPAGRITVMP